jgi:hypothetical protein
MQIARDIIGPNNHEKPEEGPKVVGLGRGTVLVDTEFDVVFDNVGGEQLEENLR